MTRDEYARIKRIVSGALSLPTAGRLDYVNETCGSDDAIRREVESLLAAAVHAENLYEQPGLLVAGTTPAVFDEWRLAPEGVPLTASLLLDASLDDFAGTDRYSVSRRIGAGGMGVVYEVVDRLCGQKVALKTLRRRDGHDIYQLKNEFRNLADVSHPNLIGLYDLVVDDEQCYFTMELIDGVTFVDDVRQVASGAGAADRARRVLPQLIAGVQELHRRGLQHRDIKPSNVLVTPEGRVVVLDFGLTSRLLHEELTGGPAGTPAYLAPEQCLGEEVTEASDWYGVGATLYHALTGRPPFDGPLRELIVRKTSEDPPHVADLAPDAPSDLADICMALLRRDPRARLSGAEAIDRLSGSRSLSVGEGPGDAVFVGRAAALGALDAALQTVTLGGSASVVIYGPSGIGKSALVQRFIDRNQGRGRVLAFRSRCHEHESIPYKALDGVIDGMTRHLSALTAAERAEVLPADAHALAKLFPVLRAVGVGRDVDQAYADPLLLREQAFTVFRELLGRLAGRQPLVIDIDDFHWADGDSVGWLTGLLRPPGPLSVLTLVSFRGEEIDAKPHLRSLIERVDIGERHVVALTPLSDDEVGTLIEALAPAEAHAGSGRRLRIARDSGGNPFLAETLARHLADDDGDGDGATLDGALTRRIEALPSASRAFLDMLAVCGRPMLPSRIFEAIGFRGDDRRLLAQLRAVHLVRNSRTADRVELYHDRIRETLAAKVQDATARRIHDVLARVLVAHGDDDPEALFDHYRAAGQHELAARFAAAAAAKANGVLAFDLAATFYGYALDLHPDAAMRVEWRAELAQALENAGRPVDAAEAYLTAAQQSSGAKQIHWRRKAAELLLVGGRIDRGLAVIEDVLDTVGVRLARNHATALVSLAVRRLQRRWRGLEFSSRPESEIPRDDLLRIDACWSIIVGLAMVDPIRAADFNVRQLLWALDVGDPYRVARALALEGGFSVIVPVAAGRGGPEALYRRAERLAGTAGRQYVAALTSLWEGIGAFLTGRWRDATQLCGAAATTLRDRCTGVMWELNLAQNFYLFSLLYRGEVREAAGHLPGLLRSAQERGNRYLELELSTRLSLVWLAADEPGEAERRADEGMARWVQRGFQRPHYHHLLTLLQTRLYRGSAREAWDLMERHSADLQQTLFRRVQHTRIEIANYRARCALSLAAYGEDAPRLRATAAREAERIRREHRSWSDPFAMLVLATVAHQEGHDQDAIAGLAEAASRFRAADMYLYAAVCDRRLGALLGGETGRATRERAEAWLASQHIRNPVAMARLITPGFVD